jgi:hypothetical protein
MLTRVSRLIQDYLTTQGPMAMDDANAIAGEWGPRPRGISRFFLSTCLILSEINDIYIYIYRVNLR